MKISDVDVERMIAGYHDLDDLADFSSRNKRQRTTQMIYYPQKGTYDLNGYESDFHKSNCTIEETLQRIHPTMRDKWKELIMLLNECKEPVVRFYTVIKPWRMETYRILSILLSGVPDENGKIKFYTGFSNDISFEIYERQQMLQKQKRSENLKTFFKISLWSYDPSKGIVYSDNSYTDEFYHDYTEREFLDLIHPDYIPLVMEKLSDMNNGHFNPESFEACILSPNGDYHYFQVVPEELDDKEGRTVRYVFVCRDVTQEREKNFRFRTTAWHIHQILEECGIRLFSYKPGGQIFKREDAYADKHLKNIPLDSLLQRIPEGSRDRIKHVFAKCDKNIKVKEDEIVKWHSFDSDEIRKYRVSIMPVYDEKENLIEYGIVRYDITEESEQQSLIRFLEKVGKIGAWSYKLETKKSRMTEEACNILGVDFNENKNMSFARLSQCVMPQDQEYFIKKSYEILKKKNEAEMYFHIMTPDGTVKHVEMRILIRRTKDGMPYYAYGTIMDVSERVQLIEARKSLYDLLTTVLNNIPISVFIKDIDDDYRIVMANDIYASYYNKKTNDIIGKNLSEYCNDERLNILIEKDRLAALCNIDKPNYEISRDEGKKGENRYYQNTTFALPLRGRNLLLGVSTDVTDLQMAKEKAESNDRLKSAFLANMSHEIRTPLNAIVGFSDLIVNNVSPEDNQQFKQIIQTNTQNLLRLIGDILDMSKLETNSMQFSFDNFNLNEMMHEAFRMMQEKFSDKPSLKLIYKEVDTPFLVYQDRMRIIGVVNNFLMNAYKYVNQGDVTMWVEEKKDRFRIYVKDNGNGIPEDKKEIIFNRFETADGLTYGGTGLGLAINKAICDRLGGAIGLESEEGKGCLFWAEFPIDGKVYPL